MSMVAGLGGRETHEVTFCTVWFWMVVAVGFIEFGSLTVFNVSTIAVLVVFIIEEEA